MSDEAVSNDPRVTSIEGFNARDLGPDTIGGEPPDLVVSDVSFISLKLVLPPALRLAESGARGVFLVKPQFEAGREAMAKGGMRRNPQDYDKYNRRVAEGDRKCVKISVHKHEGETGKVKKFIDAARDPVGTGKKWVKKGWGKTKEKIEGSN